MAALNAADERKRYSYCTCGPFTVTLKKNVCRERPLDASEDNVLRGWRV